MQKAVSRGWGQPAREDFAAQRKGGWGAPRTLANSGAAVLRGFWWQMISQQGGCRPAVLPALGRQENALAAGSAVFPASG